MPIAGQVLRAAVPKCVCWAVVAGLLALGPSAHAATNEEPVHIATLEWPPFASQDLPGGGATTEVIRAAFAAAGYQVKVTFHSWTKAIDLARKGTDDVLAYYPGYHCRHRSGFTPSKPVGESPLGFAEHVDAPLHWNTLDDLGERKLKIGTVHGYTNTDEFDAKVGIGWIHAIPSESDIKNLHKLQRKRIDAAVIDKFVFAYLTRTDARLKGHAGTLRFNEKLLENKNFHLCFRDDALGKQIVQDFDKGLARLNSHRIVEDYIAATFRD